MTNADILSSVDAEISQVAKAIAVHDSAKSNLANLESELQKAKADLHKSLSDSETDAHDLAAVIPAKQALISVLETQISAAQKVVKTTLDAVHTDGQNAAMRAGAVAGQWKAYQRALDRTTLYNFVTEHKRIQCIQSIDSVLSASATVGAVEEWVQRFAVSNPAKVPASHQNILSLSANWSLFRSAIASVQGLTLSVV
jgi:septal ring factor EnvC (AmiA/AmiB activator)